MGQSQTLREKVNMLNSKILMPLMALSFILFNTVINLYIGERIETIQNLLAIAVLAVLAFWLLSDVKAGLMPWLRQNILVIGYFAARAMISSCVVFFASTSPASLPPLMTKIRSHTPRSSGISEDTIRTTFPLLARSIIS